MPTAERARRALEEVTAYIDQGDQAYIDLPESVSEPQTHPDAILALAHYSRHTGHRLLLDYRNEHGRPSVRRPVVVDKVHTGSSTGQQYLLAFEWRGGAAGSLRTFRLERIGAARLAGAEAGADAV